MLWMFGGVVVVVGGAISFLNFHSFQKYCLSFRYCGSDVLRLESGKVHSSQLVL